MYYVLLFEFQNHCAAWLYPRVNGIMRQSSVFIARRMGGMMELWRFLSIWMFFCLVYFDLRVSSVRRRRRRECVTDGWYNSNSTMDRK